jgi:hypothetical protein
MRNLAIVLFLAWAANAAEAPSAIQACAAKAGVGYKASQKVSPSYLQADFDGDGKPDYAVLVERGGAQRVVVCRAGAGQPVILGAGIAFNDMKNLDFTSWRVHPRKQPVSRGMGAGRPPLLPGDALYLEWEGGSGIVYWRVNRFVWYQQGD